MIEIEIHKPTLGIGRHALVPLRMDSLRQTFTGVNIFVVLLYVLV